MAVMTKDDVRIKKVINPCRCYTGNSPKRSQGYVEITYENGELSMHGVIGPMNNGNALGSCGQCVEEIRKGQPNSGWTKEKIKKLCDIWNTWHLNKLRPYCQHQKALDWDKKACEEVTIYNYSLTYDAIAKQRNAERKASNSLKNGKTFTPSVEDVFYANLEYSVKTYNEPISDDLKQFYKPHKPLWAGDVQPTQRQARGWLTVKDSPELGILGKECPVCGYKYGSAWQTEEVPSDVIKFLKSLPDSERVPAWI